jgi:predicted dehydrogenase
MRTMRGKKVRIGFVGVGAMGQCAHLRNYAALGEECEVVALAELKERQGRLVAERYGVPQAYSSHVEMLDKEELDGVVAAQPFRRHGVLIPDLAEHGLPVFIEKPLALSVQVGETIVRALDKNGCGLMVGYHKRSDPATMYAKAAIDAFKDSHELGALKYVRTLMPAGDWVAGGFDTLLRSDDPQPELEMDPAPDDMDEETFKIHNAFVNYYIHQVNLIRHLLGEPYAVTHADPSGVLMVGMSRSGIPCVLEMSPYRTTVDWQESAFVAFERGYVKLELPAPLAYNRAGSVEILKDPGDRPPERVRPDLPWTHAMKEQALNFIRFVRGDAPAPCGAKEALEDLRLAREYVRLLTGK